MICTNLAFPENHMNERDAVKRLGDAIGYGYLMQLAEQIWGEIQPGGQHTTGPAAFFMVPCSHPVLDAHGLCEVCCGAGRVTRWVAENLPKP